MVPQIGQEAVDRPGRCADVGDCSGALGYNDLREGASVTVTDEDGKIIGVSMLDAGRPRGSSECDFSFTINGVLPASVYGIAVSRRGVVNYAEAQMEAQAWDVGLSVGH